SAQVGLERLDHQRERDRRTQGRAPSDQAARSCPRKGLKFTDQARLTDARLSGDQDDARADTRGIQLLSETRQLIRPTDERGLCHEGAECTGVSVGDSGSVYVPSTEVPAAAGRHIRVTKY